MIDCRRFVGDAGFFPTANQVREIVVLLQAFARLDDDGMELSSQRTILDMCDFVLQFNPAVPDFQWR